MKVYSLSEWSAPKILRGHHVKAIVSAFRQFSPVSLPISLLQQFLSSLKCESTSDSSRSVVNQFNFSE